MSEKRRIVKIQTRTQLYSAPGIWNNWTQQGSLSYSSIDLSEFPEDEADSYYKAEKNINDDDAKIDGKTRRKKRAKASAARVRVRQGSTTSLRLFLFFKLE